MFVGSLFSLAETWSRRGKEYSSLIFWNRCKGSETLVLPISNRISEVETSLSLVRDL